MLAWLKNWRRPEVLLILLSIAMPLSLQSWMALINNFAIEQVAFDGADMGILQSLREIPGFLAFGTVFLLLVMREQTVAYITLLLLGLGMALTGFLPTFLGVIFTTVLASIGFHYFETVRNSLALQWLSKEKTPELLGRIISAASLAAVAIFAINWLLLDLVGLEMLWAFLIGGTLTMVIALIAWILFPQFPEKVTQNKNLVLRRRYWLYYLLTFMQGARRQIFTVFAGFLMVEKFHFSAADVSLMFLFNMVITILIAPAVGRLVARWGERRALSLEYIGLVLVFSAYALVSDAHFAVVLYVLDHLFFALHLAINTYFQKIADPADIAPTAGVAFTINHIAAVAIPAGFGLIWLISPAWVFLAGAAMAGISLGLARLVPDTPTVGNEIRLPSPQGHAPSA